MAPPRRMVEVARRWVWISGDARAVATLQGRGPQCTRSTACMAGWLPQRLHMDMDMLSTHVHVPNKSNVNS
jgi:hypothetical protein